MGKPSIISAETVLTKLNWIRWVPKARNRSAAA